MSKRYKLYKGVYLSKGFVCCFVHDTLTNQVAPINSTTDDETTQGIELTVMATRHYIYEPYSEYEESIKGAKFLAEWDTPTEAYTEGGVD